MCWLRQSWYGLRELVWINWVRFGMFPSVFGVVTLGEGVLVTSELVWLSSICFVLCLVSLCKVCMINGHFGYIIK